MTGIVVGAGRVGGSEPGAAPADRFWTSGRLLALSGGLLALLHAVWFLGEPFRHWWPATAVLAVCCAAAALPPARFRRLATVAFALALLGVGLTILPYGALHWMLAVPVFGSLHR